MVLVTVTDNMVLVVVEETPPLEQDQGLELAPPVSSLETMPPLAQVLLCLELERTSKLAFIQRVPRTWKDCCLNKLKDTPGIIYRGSLGKFGCASYKH